MRENKMNLDVTKINLALKEFVLKTRKLDGILSIYLFGSYANNKLHPLSDVDVCLVGDISEKDKTDILIGKFSDMFDINFLEDLPIWIKARVFRDGKCLFVNDEKKLNLVKLKTLSEYLDFKPVLDEIIKKELTQNV